MAAPGPAPGPSSSGRSTQSGGVSVGKYKRLDHIGKGSFATVYKAVHPVSTLLLADSSISQPFRLGWFAGSYGVSNSCANFLCVLGG